MAASAMATEPMQGSAISIEQAASLLHYSNGNDQMRLEVAPNYSEELGWSVKGAAGTYLSDTAAIGLLVEYGTNKREYLSNLGFQLTDSLSFVGTIGMLEEHIEFVDDEDRQKVQQMEYGMSLKSAKNGGSFSGFELNGYLADAKTDNDSVEAGKLYGVQLLKSLDLGDTTHLKIGGGHEWLRWDGGEGDDNRFTFSAEGSQGLTDNLSLNARAKLGASENVYEGGLAHSLSDTSLNTIGLNYSFIEGRSGIENDQRVMLSWNVGFGRGPSSQAADISSTHGDVAVKPAADLAPVVPKNGLLTDVTKRPSYLPERVLAKATSDSGCAADGFRAVILPDYASGSNYYVITRSGQSIKITYAYIAPEVYNELSFDLQGLIPYLTPIGNDIYEVWVGGSDTVDLTLTVSRSSEVYVTCTLKYAETPT